LHSNCIAPHRGELAGVVPDLVKLAIRADVQDGVAQLREEAAALLPVGDALVGVFRRDLCSVLVVAREVEPGLGGDAGAARGALYGLGGGGREEGCERVCAFVIDVWMDGRVQFE
jgi:hypothetical protein